MKKISIIYIAIFLLLGIAYLVADGELYYFGRSKYNIFNKTLPLEMKPDYWDGHVCWPPVGFTVEDRYGFLIFGKRKNYILDGDTIRVNRIIKYGIGHNKVIAFIEDANNRNYFIECQKNTQPRSKIELEVNVLNKNIKINGDYKWVNIVDNERKISWLVTTRFYIMTSLIVLILSVPVVLFIRKRMK